MNLFKTYKVKDNCQKSVFLIDFKMRLIKKKTKKGNFSNQYLKACLELMISACMYDSNFY